MKKIIWILLLMIAAVSCQKAGTLSVMTFNVRLGVALEQDSLNNWENRREAAVAMIADIAPAAIGVQEAYDFQLEYIVERCPQYQCVGVGREDGIHGGEHMSVLYDTTRLELKDWGTYWLSETPDVPSFGWDAACKRTATWTLLQEKQGGRKFFFVNTHLDHVGVQARRNGLALVVERIGEMNPEGWPMILCGDFNVYPDDPCLTDLRAMMTDAWTSAAEADDGTTWHDWGRNMDDRHIDYIFYSGFSGCKSIRRITQSYGTSKFVSDHFPVAAELEW